MALAKIGGDFQRYADAGRLLEDQGDLVPFNLQGINVPP
jgi:hypothetical protein